MRGGYSSQQYCQDGRVIRKPQEMANLQIKYYEDKIKKLIEKIPVSNRNPLRFLDSSLDSWEGKVARPTFNFQEISLEETGKLISNLGSSSSFGHDQLDGLALKEVGPHILIPLKHLINKSLQKWKFVQCWKLTCLSPRLKSSDLDKMSVSSYRPIATLSTISK